MLTLVYAQNQKPQRNLANFCINNGDSLKSDLHTSKISLKLKPKPTKLPDTRLFERASHMTLLDLSDHNSDRLTSRFENQKSIGAYSAQALNTTDRPDRLFKKQNSKLESRNFVLPQIYQLKLSKNGNIEAYNSTTNPIHLFTRRSEQTSNNSTARGTGGKSLNSRFLDFSLKSEHTSYPNIHSPPISLVTINNRSPSARFFPQSLQLPPTKEQLNLKTAKIFFNQISNNSSRGLNTNSEGSLSDRQSWSNDLDSMNRCKTPTTSTIDGSNAATLTTARTPSSKTTYVVDYIKRLKDCRMSTFIQHIQPPLNIIGNQSKIISKDSDITCKKPLLNNNTNNIGRYTEPLKRRFPQNKPILEPISDFSKGYRLSFNNKTKDNNHTPLSFSTKNVNNKKDDILLTAKLTKKFHSKNLKPISDSKLNRLSSRS